MPLIDSGSSAYVINPQAFGPCVSTNIVTCGNIWPAWNTQFVYSTETVTTNFVWANWVGAAGNQTTNAAGATNTYNLVVAGAGVPYEQTEGYKNQAVAKARADALLNTILSAEQRSQFAHANYFEVTVGSNGATRRYRVKYGLAGNVFLLDDKGREVAKYCLHPHTPVPVADNLIAQKLLLESDEPAFLRTANMTLLRAA